MGVAGGVVVVPVGVLDVADRSGLGTLRVWGWGNTSGGAC